MSSKNKIFFIVTSLIFATAFIYLSFWVHRDIFRDVDVNALLFLQNNIIGRQIDVPFSYLTIFGSTEVTISIIGIIFLLSLFWFRRLFLSIFLFFLIFLFEYLSKLFIFHPNPPNMFNRYALKLHLPSSFFVHTNFSYPSGHVARTTFIAGILLFFILRWRTDRYKKIILVALLMSFLTAVLVSRIYLGEHWLSDVLGGFILGAGISFLAIGFW